MFLGRFKSPPGSRFFWVALGFYTVFLAALSLTVSADPIYRWVDADGVIHFSERPAPSSVPRGTEVGTDQGGSASPSPAEVPASLVRHEGGGVFWKIEKPGRAPSYLLGTIHSEDPRVLDLPDSVRRAFDRADSYTMEILPDAGTLGALAGAMLLGDDASLRELLGERLFDELADVTAPRGIPSVALDRMKPWAVMTTLTIPPPKTGLILDIALYREAVSRGKEVYGIETPDEQLRVFDRIPLDDQVVLLKETLEHLDEIDGLYERMVRAYVANDLNEIRRLAEESLSWGNRHITDPLMTRLLDDRNRIMAERILPRLHKGGAFIAVGALHLPGETGLLRALRRSGFRVTPGG